MKPTIRALTVLIPLALPAACERTAPTPDEGPPVPVAMAATSDIDRGRTLYLDYGCVLCHGLEGKGGIANSNAETDGKVPALSYVAEGFTPRELETKLTEGLFTIGKEDPNGAIPPFRMPAYRDLMSASEKKALVAYLLSLYPEDEAESWTKKGGRP